MTIALQYGGGGGAEGKEREIDSPIVTICYFHF